MKNDYDLLLKNIEKKAHDDGNGSVVVNIKDIQTIFRLHQQGIDQVRWERDVALDQLHSIGKDLGEKMDDVVRVVRCRDCKYSEAANKWVGKEHSNMVVHCEIHDDFPGVDYFCGEGARR